MIDMFIGFIIVAAVFFYFGMKYERFAILKKLETMIDKEDETEAVKSEYINISVEEHDGQLFAYDDTHLYLAHAEDPNVLVENLGKRFPGRKFMADTDSVDLLMKRSNDVTI